MMIITPETCIPYECRHINELMQTGDHLLHLRKYTMNDHELSSFIDSISCDVRKRLVLHSHFHLAPEMGIERLHFNESSRKLDLYREYAGHYILSTSVHSVKDFNSLPGCWTYAFIAPVFPSISKRGYGVKETVLEHLQYKKNPTVGLIGLGGINARNCRMVLEAGADDIAVLGSVWENGDPCNAVLHIMQSLT